MSEELKSDVEKLVESLLERAKAARAEGTATATADAWHFEKAAFYLCSEQRNPKNAETLWCQFAENGNMQFFTRDPDRAVEESFCYARPLTAFYEKPFDVEDFRPFKDLIGFAALAAINLPETDPRRDFIRQSNELVRIIDSPKGVMKK